MKHSRRRSAPIAGPSRLGELFTGISLEKAEGCEDDLCALRTRLEMKEKSVSHYETLAQATESVHGRALCYLTLAHEERGRNLHVMDAIEYLCPTR